MSESPFFFPTMPHFPEAKCAEISDPDIFFIEKPKELDKVIDDIRDLCMACPHAQACIKFALDEEIEFGVWGGFTPSQRKRMRPAKYVRHRTDVAERVFALRAQGVTFREIASSLDITTSAAQKAVARYVAKKEAS